MARDPDRHDPGFGKRGAQPSFGARPSQQPPPTETMGLTGQRSAIKTAIAGVAALALVGLLMGSASSGNFFGGLLAGLGLAKLAGMFANKSSPHSGPVARQTTAAGPTAQGQQSVTRGGFGTTAGSIGSSSSGGG